MVRPRISGQGKKRKTFQRIAVDYSHKQEVITFTEDGHTLDQTIEHFYGKLQGSDIRAKKKQINKWLKQRATIRDACDSGRGRHRNLRKLGEATVLPKDAETELVLWVNSLRKDGAPVSRKMLQLQAKEVAADSGVGDKFSASPTWIKLFLHRHKFSLRARTRQGQTTPEDAEDAAKEFRALVRRTIVEQKCTQVLNADQTAVFFEYLPKQTISERGVKTVWVKCANKEKSRATAMLLADWEGKMYPVFLLFKSNPAKSKEKQKENDELRHGFGETVWKREVRALQAKTECEIYGNKCAWWNKEMSLTFLKYQFAGRPNPDENVLLLWDDFSGHWTPEVVAYAASINVVLLKVPPRYTYVCQPADVSWNKPFKSGLRTLWIDCLRGQLVDYRNGSQHREEKRLELQRGILKARKELPQAEADVEVARLQQKQSESAFKLKPPSRSDIVHWISKCWSDLSMQTIFSGFGKVGILNDTRVVDSGIDFQTIESSIVQDLENCALADEEVTSDDDIGSGGESGSDSDTA